MATWDPALYLKFNEQRSRPATDLALRARALLGERSDAKRPLSILDLGCGPGNSTAILAAVFPGADLLGLDSSAEMIAAARASGLAAEWVTADAALWEADRNFGLVFSNAALQWIPDQAATLGRMWTSLAPGGALAVQVPGNGTSPLHRALRSVAASGPWRMKFAGLDDFIRYNEPDFYYECLAPLDGSVEVWETTYWHVLGGHGALIDWYKGTGMRPWLELLEGESERKAFTDAVLETAAPEYPLRDDGSVFFPFRRIFFTATKTTGVNS
jgi:trans-aconitate 2-methyltransferase